MSPTPAGEGRPKRQTYVLRKGAFDEALFRIPGPGGHGAAHLTGYLAEGFCEKILAVASGEKTKSELNGVGEEEFAPWGVGPTL